MSLINCPECGQSVSNKANTCPNCGFPVWELTSVLENESTETDKTDNKKRKIIKTAIILIVSLILCSALIVGMVLLFYRSNNDCFLKGIEWGKSKSEITEILKNNNYLTDTTDDSVTVDIDEYLNIEGLKGNVLYIFENDKLNKIIVLNSSDLYSKDILVKKISEKFDSMYGKKDNGDAETDNGWLSKDSKICIELNTFIVYTPINEKEN